MRINLSMTNKDFNVGIIGYGLSAKVFHIPLISKVPELKIYAIVQRNPKPNDDAEQDLPGVKRYRSSEDLMKDDGVDVVILTTTPETHFDLAKLALESGKHGMYCVPCPMLVNSHFAVVVEKPFTPTSTEARELISIAKKCNRFLTIYQSKEALPQMLRPRPIEV